LPGSNFRFPVKHSVTLSKLPYAGKFENKYLPLITNETDLDELRIYSSGNVTITKTENLKKVKILSIVGPSEV
jgi:hypothetical protein